MKWMIGVIILVILVSVYLYDFFYFNEVNYEMEMKYKSPVTKIQQYYILLNSSEQFKNFIKREDLLLPYSNIINSSIFDFNNYDYLITFGNELESLGYSKYLNKYSDGCSYAKEIPLFVNFKKEESLGDHIFIYKIFEKNRYRDPCP